MKPVHPGPIPERHPRRHGFTLLELLIAIVIIAALMALLFPVIGRIFVTVDATQVQAEFSQLDQALSQFKREYGVIPPSRIVLSENPGTHAWDASSKRILRRIFGQTVSFNELIDFNDDGDTDDELTLTSSECLVFFLGGMPDDTTLTGFSANLEKPFARGGSNRRDPIFTFDAGRLTDHDSDDMFGYRDVMQETDGPILVYASSNNGQGYSDSAGSVNHYHQGDGTTPWNQNSYQLISPGEDGDFGFEVEPSTFDLIWTKETNPTGPQADNIANFASGTLGDQ